MDTEGKGRAQRGIDDEAGFASGAPGPISPPHGELTGIRVSELDAVALAARAVASQRFPELDFRDVYAERVLAQLELDVNRWDDALLRAAVVRTMLFDDLTRDFFARRGRESLGVGFFSGLCTRFSRIDDGLMRWVDVEHRDVAHLLSDMQPPSERHAVSSCCSIACTGWMRHLADAELPTVLVVQGGLVGAPRAAIETFLTSASKSLPSGAEILADFDARAPVRPAPRGRSLEALNDDDAWVRYPRLRFVSADEYPMDLERRIAGMNGIARLFRGRGMPALMHLRVV